MPPRRVLPTILLLLASPALAGCLEPEAAPGGAGDDPGATTTTPGTVATPTSVSPWVPPTGSPDSLGPRCGRLHASVEPADGFRPGEMAVVHVTLENCGEAPLAFLAPTCRASERLRATLSIDGRAWILGYGAARLQPPEGEDCETRLRDVPPGETAIVHAYHWPGTLAQGDCPEARPYCAWAPAGAYEGEAILAGAEGEAWNASFVVTLLEPRIPPYDDDGDLRLVLNDSYGQGETAEVRLRNLANETYVYNQHYAACGLRYYNESGYPFRIPPGTHCDLMNEQPLAPGEEVVLFRWDLDECVADYWGCGESRPLPPGTYHVSGWFRPQGASYSDESARSRVGATFTVT